MSNSVDKPEDENSQDSTSATNADGEAIRSQREMVKSDDMERTRPACKPSICQNISSHDLISAVSTPITWDNVVNPSSTSKQTANSIETANSIDANNSIDTTNSIDTANSIDAATSIETAVTVDQFNQFLQMHGISHLNWYSTLQQAPELTPRSVKQYFRKKDSEKAKEVCSRYDHVCNHDIDCNHDTDCNRNKEMQEYAPHQVLQNSTQVADLPNLANNPQTAKDRNHLNQGFGSQKRYVFGSEIALAVIIAAAGATRIRKQIAMTGLRSELIPGDDNERRRFEEDARVEDNSSHPVPPEPSGRSGLISKTRAIRPKVLIASDDTLISIAEAFFFDKDIAWLIADLNQGITKQTWVDGQLIVELKTRQQIELPLKEDVERFLKGNRPQTRTENLITIVEHSVVDSELLNDSLHKLLNPDQD